MELYTAHLKLREFGRADWPDVYEHNADPQREGHLRQHRWMKGGWHDSFLYAILEQEWNQRKTTTM